MRNPNQQKIVKRKHIYAYAGLFPGEIVTICRQTVAAAEVTYDADKPERVCRACLRMS